MSVQDSVAWDETIKKEARGTDDDDLGEIQEVGRTFVRTKRGMLSREEFFLPKYLAEGFDGQVVQFRISEAEAKELFKDSGDDLDDRYEAHFKKQHLEKVEREVTNEPDKRRVLEDIETRIPLMSERLHVQKTQTTEEAHIIKEPVTEMKTIEVPVTHEEVVVERRTVSEGDDDDTRTTTAESPVTERTDVTVPLKHEQVTVTKEPYVAEEVVIHKKPVTETQTVSDEVRSETVKVQTEGKSTKDVVEDEEK